MLARDVRRVAAAGRMWASRGCVVPVGDGSAKRVDDDASAWDYEGVWGVLVTELWRVVATFLWGPLEDVWRVLVMGFEGRCDVPLRGLAKASHGC